MTKIFITIPWFLPAFRAGGPIQSIANLIKNFNGDVEYFIFCGDVDLNGGMLENIETGRWIHFNQHTQVWYAGPENISDTLLKELEKQNPDLLFIIGLFSWHYTMVPLLFSKKTKIIISVRGMLHPGALSQKNWKKKIYLRVFKLMKLHNKISFHATDEQEKKCIQHIFSNEAKIFVGGNFPNIIGALPVTGKQTGKLKLISIALISPMKNILLVLQALEKSAAEIEYDIYGPVKDPEYWAECKEQIKILPGNINVMYHGELVPQKVSEVLSAAHVFILPSKSENFGHAIYEALSAARPVITSNNTPWNLLEESKAGINVSMDPASLLQAINFFAAMDGGLLQEWSAGANKYAERSIDTTELKIQYREMFGMPKPAIQV